MSESKYKNRLTTPNSVRKERQRTGSPLNRSFCILCLLILSAVITPAFCQETSVAPAAAPTSGDKIVTLEDCIKQAFKIHPDLKAAIALKNASKAQVNEVRSAYFPQVGYTATYSRSVIENPTTSEISGFSPLTKVESDAYRSTISMTQQIYDFGRTAFSVAVAKDNLEAASYEILSVADTIILNIRSTYYSTVAANKILEVSRESVSQQELHLKQAKGFFQVGRRSKIEVTKAEVDLANSKLTLIKSENDAKLARANLANAIGIAGSFDYPLDENVEFVELKLEFDKAIDLASKHRPDLLKIIAQENAGKNRVNQARANWYPTVNGNASYGYSNSRFTFNRIAWGWGVSLDFDVFDGGNRDYTIVENQENLKYLQATRERLWQKIYLEVQEAYLKLEESKRSIEVLEKALDKARENFNLAQGRYEVGVSDNLEFTDARVALQQAKTDLIKAILDYYIARAKLEKAIGVTVFRDTLFK
ncbi:MAG: TolC family protein [Firmicutes bacterium]|nr:TolC family protein [Bacillota bacterium]